MKALLSACAIGGAVVLGGAAPASAGGSWIHPVQDSYQPGDSVTMVGYTGGGMQGWVEDAPFYGVLLGGDRTGSEVVRLELGELTLEETGHGGWASLRASITFSLPADLEPGAYVFDYCNAGCAERLGDLIGGTVHVGVPMPGSVARYWPLDEPEIANLDPAATVYGPEGPIPAGEVQARGIPEASLTPATVAPTSTTTSSSATPTTTRPTTVVPPEGVELAGGAAPAGRATTDGDPALVPWLVATTAVVLAGAAATTALVRRSQARRPH